MTSCLSVLMQTWPLVRLCAIYWLIFLCSWPEKGAQHLPKGVSTLRSLADMRCQLISKVIVRRSFFKSSHSKLGHTWLDVYNYACIIICFHHYMISTNGYMFSCFFTSNYVICTVQMVICIELYTYNPNTHSYAHIIIHYLSSESSVMSL